MTTAHPPSPGDGHTVDRVVASVPQKHSTGGGNIRNPVAGFGRPVAIASGATHPAPPGGRSARSQNRLLGVITIGGGMGSAAGSWAAGWIFDLSGSYRLAFILATAAYLGGCIAFQGLRRPAAR
jgi:hypothetical protein